MNTFDFMRLHRQIISVVLLFTYLIGYAHDFVPHRHIDDLLGGEIVVSEIAHRHLDSPETSKELSVVNNHIVHENHLDESFFNYVLCVLSEIKHPETNGHYILANFTDDLVKVKLQAVLFVLIGVIVVLNLILTIKEQPSLVYLSRLVVAIKHRGPPHI